jgi:hypothetical protein
MRKVRVQFGALCVVRLVELLAVVRRLLAEADDNRPRRVVLDHAQDQVGRPEKRVHGAAVGTLDRLREREERPEEDRVAVDYEQGLAGQSRSA